MYILEFFGVMINFTLFCRKWNIFLATKRRHLVVLVHDGERVLRMRTTLEENRRISILYLNLFFFFISIFYIEVVLENRYHKL